MNEASPSQPPPCDDLELLVLPAWSAAVLGLELEVPCVMDVMNKHSTNRATLSDHKELFFLFLPMLLRLRLIEPNKI